MERRFRVRLAELLDDAHVPPTLLRGVLPRLQTFLQPERAWSVHRGGLGSPSLPWPRRV